MKKDNVFWGVILIIGAILVLINSTGILAGINVFKIVLTVLLVVIFLKSIVSKNFWGMFFSLAFLCIVYDEQLGIESITPGPVLIAALLASIGCSMIFEKKTDVKYSMNPDNFTTTTDEVTGDVVNFSTNFGSSIKNINSDNF